MGDENFKAASGDPVEVGQRYKIIAFQNCEVITIEARDSPGMDTWRSNGGRLWTSDFLRAPECATMVGWAAGYGPHCQPEDPGWDDVVTRAVERLTDPALAAPAATKLAATVLDDYAKDKAATDAYNARVDKAVAIFGGTPAATKEPEAQPPLVPERSPGQTWDTRWGPVVLMKQILGTESWEVTCANGTPGIVFHKELRTLISEPETAPNHLRNLATGEMTPTVAPKAPINPHDFSDPYCISVSRADKVTFYARLCLHCGTREQEPPKPTCIPWNWRHDNERAISEAMLQHDTERAKKAESLNQRSPIANGAQSHVHPRGCLGIWDIRGGR